MIVVDPPDLPSLPASPQPLFSCCILQLCIQLIASVHHETILENLTLLKHKTADDNVGVVPWGYIAVKLFNPQAALRLQQLSYTAVNICLC